jgi:glucosamine-6-phosphate deaminase
MAYLVSDRNGSDAVRVEPTVFDGVEAIGRALATLIADELVAAGPRRPFLLGCPSGRSPWSTYRALAREVAARQLDLSGLVIVMMDEYVERDDATGAMRRVDPGAPHSCLRFGQTEIVDRLNAAAGPGRGIDPGHYWVPDPASPERYDQLIADHGGIDLFILASGAGDGHVAFNPPGTARDTRTRIVRLAEQTRRDNLHTFPSFGGDLDRVPRYGITVGVGTIREYSKRVVMVAHGDQKACTVRRMVEAEHYLPEWPATVVAECARPALFVDAAAASGLDANGLAASELDGSQPAATTHQLKETGWLA